ncbi:MAG TPA: type II toxin-antitoxin system VapC family toxin [Anaerolineales bacterium]|nr:type II toxin-antitoxin system VapC family toxin [Anaerolineales bacterium]
MIVIDTNIIGYLYLSSEHSIRVEAALLRDPEWCAPLLWRSELRNVLAFYLRKNLLSLPEAQQIMEEAIQRLQGREYEIVSHQVLALAAESSCSAYDCEFVALAQDLDVHLVTTDKQILTQFPHIALSLEEFTG